MKSGYRREGRAAVQGRPEPPNSRHLNGRNAALSSRSQHQPGSAQLGGFETFARTRPDDEVAPIPVIAGNGGGWRSNALAEQLDAALIERDRLISRIGKGIGA